MHLKQFRKCISESISKIISELDLCNINKKILSYFVDLFRHSYVEVSCEIAVPEKLAKFSGKKTMEFFSQYSIGGLDFYFFLSRTLS